MMRRCHMLEKVHKRAGRITDVITSNVATCSDGSGDCQTSRLKNCPARKQLSELGHSDFRPPVLVTPELPNLKIGRLFLTVKTSLPQANFQIPGYPNFFVQVKTSDLSAMISASPATPASKSFSFLPWLCWILMAMLQHLCKNSPIC